MVYRGIDKKSKAAKRRMAARRKDRLSPDDARILVALEDASRRDWRAVLRKSLDDKAFAAIDPAHLARVSRRMAVCHAWRLFVQRVKIRRGRMTDAKASFVAAARERYGRGVSARSLDRWLNRSRIGARGLLGNPGRRSRAVVIDETLWSFYCARLFAGEAMIVAHRAIAKQADREGKPWPAFWVVRDRIREGLRKMSVRRRWEKLDRDGGRIA